MPPCTSEECLNRAKQIMDKLRKDLQVLSSKLDVGELIALVVSNDLVRVIVGLEALIDSEPLPITVINMPDGTKQTRDPMDIFRAYLDQLKNLSDENIVVAAQVVAEREAVVEQKIAQFQQDEAELQRVQAQSAEKEKRLEKELAESEKALSNATQAAEEAKSTAYQLRKRISDADVIRANTTEGCAEVAASILNDRDNSQREVELLVAREVQHRKTLNELRSMTAMIPLQIDALRKRHAEEIAALHEDYRKQVNANNPIATSREQALQNQVDKLTMDLQRATDELRLGNSKANEVLEHLQTTQKPYSDLAQELFQLNLRYKALTQALMPLEQERDAYMTKVAENELACARNVHALTSENRATIDRLNQELSAKHVEIANKQNEIQALNARLNSIRSEMETRVAQLNTALSAKSTELASLQSTVDHQVKMAQDRQRMGDLNIQSEKSKLEFAYRQRMDALQAKYDALIREASDKQQNAAHQITLQKQEMEANQRRLANAQNSVNAQAERLEQLKIAYDAKMAEFDKQESQLRTLQMATQDKYDHLLTQQKDTQTRIQTLQNAAQMERNAANARETKLRNDLDQAMKDRNFIQKSYEECAVARDAILGKVTILQGENNDLKMQLTAFQAQFDAVKAQHNATLNEMRRKVVESQSGLARCAESLQDASQVHEHVKRLAEENRRVMEESKRQLAKVSDSEKAMRTLMTDKVRASEEVLRLQSALQECAASKNVLSNQVASSQSRVQALQKMDSTLAATLETTSADFSSALRRRDAEMAREEIKRKAKEKEMQGKLARLIIEKQGLEQRLAKEQVRHRSTEDLLVENVVANAATVEGLLSSR